MGHIDRRSLKKGEQEEQLYRVSRASGTALSFEPRIVADRFVILSLLLACTAFGGEAGPQPCAEALHRVSTSDILVRFGCGVAAELELDHYIRAPIIRNPFLSLSLPPSL